MDRAMGIAVVQQRQMPMVQMMRTKAEMQQVHSLNKVVDVPVVMQRARSNHLAYPKDTGGSADPVH